MRDRTAGEAPPLARARTRHTQHPGAELQPPHSRLLYRYMMMGCLGVMSVLASTLRVVRALAKGGPGPSHI